MNAYLSLRQRLLYKSQRVYGPIPVYNTGQNSHRCHPGAIQREYKFPMTDNSCLVEPEQYQSQEVPEPQSQTIQARIGTHLEWKDLTMRS